MAYIDVQIRSNRFPEAAAKSRGGLQKGVNAAANRIVAQAQSQARRKSGDMADQTAVTEAGGGKARVVAPMYYSGYQNWGTSRGVTADYWFSSAVDAERERFAAEFESMFNM